MGQAEQSPEADAYVYYFLVGVGPKPITLILMMINSCSYCSNDLMFNKFQIFDQDLSQCLASIKDSRSAFEASTY